MISGETPAPSPGVQTWTGKKRQTFTQFTQANITIWQTWKKNVWFRRRGTAAREAAQDCHPWRRSVGEGMHTGSNQGSPGSILKILFFFVHYLRECKLGPEKWSIMPRCACLLMLSFYNFFLCQFVLHTLWNKSIVTVAAWYCLDCSHNSF